MKLSSSYVLVFCSVLSILFGSCTSDKMNWQGTVEEVDGVTIVKNPEEPLHKESSIVLNEEISIGVGEGAEEYMFAAVGMLTVDESGNIFVADSREIEIKIFNPNGQFVRRVGNKGQGPGEFSRIDYMHITSENEIFVVDNVNRRTSYFSKEGELIKSDSIQELPASSSNWKVDGRGNFVMDTAQFTRENQLVVETKLYNSEYEFMKVLNRSKPYNLSVTFSPFHYWVISASDQIIYAQSDSYEFLVYSPDGTLLKKVARDYSPQKILKYEIEEEFKRKRLPPETKVPEFHPAFYLFVVDDIGRIFVRTWERAEVIDSYFIDVFDSDGKYLTKFSFHAMPRLIRNEKMYTVEEDDQGYHIIKRYNMEWDI